MAAQNIGAGRWDCVGLITRWGLFYNVALTGALVVAVALADRRALSLFLSEGSPSIAIAQHINLLVSWGFILFGATMVLFGVVRANGAVIAPLVILGIALFAIRLGGAFALEPLLGTDAIWWSFPLGSAASLVMAFWYYLRGGWRTARLDPAVDAVEARTARLHPRRADRGGTHVPC